MASSPRGLGTLLGTLLLTAAFLAGVAFYVLTMLWPRVRSPTPSSRDTQLERWSRFSAARPQLATGNLGLEATEHHLRPDSGPLLFLAENSGERARSHFRTYEKARRACFLRAERRTVGLQASGDATSPDKSLMYFVADAQRVRHAEVAQPTVLNVVQCTAAGSTVWRSHSGEGGEGDGGSGFSQAPATQWRVARIGPLTSRGNTTWHTIKMRDPFRLAGTVFSAAAAPPASDQRSVPPPARQRVRVRSRLAAAVDGGSGEVLPYPPIHIHHWHLTPRWAGGEQTVLHTVWAQASPRQLGVHWTLAGHSATAGCPLDTR